MDLNFVLDLNMVLVSSDSCAYWMGLGWESDPDIVVWPVHFGPWSRSIRYWYWGMKFCVLPVYWSHLGSIYGWKIAQNRSVLRKLHQARYGHCHNFIFWYIISSRPTNDTWRKEFSWPLLTEFGICQRLENCHNDTNCDCFVPRMFSAKKPQTSKIEVFQTPSAVEVNLGHIVVGV